MSQEAASWLFSIFQNASINVPCALTVVVGLSVGIWEDDIED
jgi:hypothetical protein